MKGKPIAAEGAQGELTRTIHRAACGLTPNFIALPFAISQPSLT